jgi:hypothetical protein
MLAFNTPLSPEAMHPGLIYSLTGDHQDHPSPPGEDDDDEMLENQKSKPPERDESQAEPKAEE